MSNETPSRLRVLVVEDRPADADLVVRELRRAGFTVDARVVATEAEYASALDPSLDLILCDLNLPHYDGLRALAHLKERGFDVPFIVITGSVGDGRAAESIKRGAADFLLKDRLSRLGSAVTNALDRKRLVAEARATEARRLEAERALEESDSLFHEFADAMKEVFFVVDKDNTKTIYVSPAYEKIWGRSRQSLYERPLSFLDIVHPDDRASLGAIADIGERAVSLEYRIVRDDGSVRWIRARIFPIRNARGEIYRAGGIAEDVTDRKLAEEQLALQSAALAAAANAIVITDLDGRILWVNPAFTRMTGYTSDEAIGNSPRILRSGVHPSAFYESLWKTISSGNVWSGEITNRRKDGTLYFEEMTITPIRSAGVVSHFIGIKQDVTARKRAEDDLRCALDKARESDRLKSAFLANMSHEVRTPLNVILGYNSIIAERLSEIHEEQLTFALEAVANAGQRLLGTVHGIIDLSRIETGTFEVHPVALKLAALVEDRIGEFRERAEAKGLSLTCEIDAADAEISSDEYCLQQAVDRLLDNAIKFTERGGVVVELGRDSSGTLCLSVRDTGIGIDSTYVSRLFDPFSQQDSGYTRRYEGPGIGLALTKRYLEINKTTISVESEKGKGTTFTIRFPESSESGADGSAPLRPDTLSVTASDPATPPLPPREAAKSEVPQPITTDLVEAGR